MNITLDDCRCSLINEILLASSLEEVKTQIATVIKSLKENKVHDHAIARFVEKTTRNLEELNPADHNLQQWTNIYYSRMEFQKIMDSIKRPKQTK